MDALHGPIGRNAALVMHRAVPPQVGFHQWNVPGEVNFRWARGGIALHPEGDLLPSAGEHTGFDRIAKRRFFAVDFKMKLLAVELRQLVLGQA